jgi:hypothetical protein
MTQIVNNQSVDWKRPWLTRSRRKAIGFYTLIAPWLIGFVLLGLFPLIWVCGSWPTMMGSIYPLLNSPA